MRDSQGVSYLHPDLLGSTMLTSGASTSSQRYLPYGGQRGTAEAATDRRYTGQRWQAQFGLYDYNARWYDPELRRFVQPDTVVPEPGNPQSLNRYAYGLNNPLKYNDPTGHFPGIAFFLGFYHVNSMFGKYIMSQLPSPGVCPGNACEPTARYDAAVDYIQQEMVTNATGLPARTAAVLNQHNLGAVAQLEWFFHSHPYSYWDHKPDLAAKLGLNQGGGDYYFPIEGDEQYEYFYDIWSNIHFGYVSAAGGFDEARIQAGGSMPFLAGSNDPYDELSVHLGYLLWEQTGGDPSQLTPEMIRDIILAHADKYASQMGNESDPVADTPHNWR